MKRVVKAAEGEYTEYVVTVRFAGMPVSDSEYEVDATSQSDAEDEALENAQDDLSIEDTEDLGEGDYEVEVGFGGMIGVSETYSISADSQDQAEDYALEEAASDLEVVRVAGE